MQLDTTQERWNSYGSGLEDMIRANPAQYVLADDYSKEHDFFSFLEKDVSDFKNMKILDVGCGRGESSVWLAKKGADVTGVDLGGELIGAANALARANNVGCDFKAESITRLSDQAPFYDAVVGLNILHHLSPPDVIVALNECHRVLKSGAKAYFYEPVENSALFDFIQNLFPLDKPGVRNYRPSILNRKAWKEHLKTVDDRAMTTKELKAAAGNLFIVDHLSSYGFLIRLSRLFGPESRSFLRSLDTFLLKYFPPLRYFSQKNIVVYKKI